MNFDHDFGYSFPLFSTLLKKRGKKKVIKKVIKSHAFLLDQPVRNDYRMVTKWPFHDSTQNKYFLFPTFQFVCNFTLGKIYIGAPVNNLCKLWKIEQKGMTLNFDFSYSFPLFSSLLKKEGKRKGEWIAKIVILSHASAQSLSNCYF